MIEVFITNVSERSVARRLLDKIHQQFNHYKANFDLDDKDRILRVTSNGEKIQQDQLIRIVVNEGFHAQVLPDELPPRENLLIPFENFEDE